MTTRAALPRRGTRPPNRRELIIDAARELFHQRGFEHVGVSDIAEAVNIGPSALYRHFPGKQQLLAAVLRREHESLMESLESPGDDVPLGLALARTALDYRGGSQLVQREARHLPDGAREEVREGSRRVGRRLSDLVRAERPDLRDGAADLLGWSVAGAIGSLSVHRLELPRDRYEALLSELVATIVACPLPAGFSTEGDRRPGGPGLALRSRREQLLIVAVRLFAERGYPNVSVEDVGAAVGISGASVYNHVGSKHDLLQTPMVRGVGYLMMDLARAFEGVQEPREVLRRLVRSYVSLALGYPDMLQLLFSEVSHLPADLQRTFRVRQREYLQEWGDLLLASRPGLDLVSARITVQAAISLVNDVVRIRRLRHAADIEDALVALCDAILL